MRGRYVAAPELMTKRAVLDTRLKDYGFNHEQVKVKTHRLKRAIVVLAAAIILIFIGAASQLVVHAVKG